MASSAQNVYMNLLSASPVSVTVQQRVHDYAVRIASVGLLTRLAMLPELDPGVEAQLGESEHLDVLLAWSSRPGRSNDELVQRLLRAKRATLLAALACREGLEADVYRSLAGSRYVTVRWTVLQNLAVPDDIRREVATGLAAEFTKQGYSAAEMLRNTLREDLALWETFLRNQSNTTVLSTAAGLPELPPALQSLIVDRLLDRDHRIDSYEFSSLLEQLVRRVDLDRTVAERLAERLEQMQSTVTSQYELRRIGDQLTKLRNRPTDGIEAMYAIIRDAEDPASLQQAVDNFVNATRGLRIDQAELARLIVDHLHTTPQLVATYIRSIDLLRLPELVRRYEQEGRHDILLAIALNPAGPQLVVPEMSDAGPLVAQIAGVLSGETTSVLADTTYAIRHVLEPWFRGGCDEDFVSRHYVTFRDHLPVGMLSVNPHCATRVNDELVQRFSGDVSRWEIFETLVGDFHGTLPNLIDTVMHLSA